MKKINVIIISSIIFILTLIGMFLTAYTEQSELFNTLRTILKISGGVLIGGVIIKTK